LTKGNKRHSAEKANQALEQAAELVVDDNFRLGYHVIGTKLFAREGHAWLEGLDVWVL
jgi:hypothetical protein